MKKITLLILVVLCYNHSRAQFLGRHYDPGCFYTIDGKKVPGLISFNKYSDFFHYKAGENSDVTKYKIEDVKGVVVIETVKNEALGGLIKRKPKGPQIVVDSFVVRSIEKPNKNLYFAKVVCDLSAYKLYVKILPPRGGGPTFSNSGGPGATPVAGGYIKYYGSSFGEHETYYEKNGVTYELTKSNFKEILAVAFADVPATLALLNDTKFKDIEKVIQSYVTAKTGIDPTKEN
jgi:hypothetical protein